MKRCMFGAVWAVLCYTAPSVAQEGNRDVPDIARREIQRRGSCVEVLGHGPRSGHTQIAQTMAPPADDSHKWFFSLISTQGCPQCDKLKKDFASHPHLRAFADPGDHKQSWSHYHVFDVSDQTQRWRWAGVRFAGFPTVLVQPPRNGRYGDPKTVVLQRAGYDGDAPKLAAAIRDAIVLYVARYERSRPQATIRGFEQSDDVAPTAGQEAPAIEQRQPPFTPPPQPAPYSPEPQPYPFEIPPPAAQPTAGSSLSLILTLVGGLLSSGALTNLLLLGVGGLVSIRELRRNAGQKLLLDDASFNALVESLKKALGESPPAKPGP